MNIVFFQSILILLVLLISPDKINANTAFDFYMNDFHSKSKEARMVLKEIENTLKECSRERVCFRQRKAARLGLLANKSLIKAFEEVGSNVPMKSIEASQQRWESMLNEC